MFKYADEKGVRSQLYFDPSLSGVEKVLAWNDNMDIIILPSRSEGLPRCIVESLSRACPCVLSDVCGLPELVNHKWLHKPGDADKLAELLLLMINDKEAMLYSAKENFNHAFDYTREALRFKRNDFLAAFRVDCENK